MLWASTNFEYGLDMHYCEFYFETLWSFCSRNQILYCIAFFYRHSCRDIYEWMWNWLILLFIKLIFNTIFDNETHINYVVKVQFLLISSQNSCNSLITLSLFLKINITLFWPFHFCKKIPHIFLWISFTDFSLLSGCLKQNWCRRSGIYINSDTVIYFVIITTGVALERFSSPGKH